MVTMKQLSITISRGHLIICKHCSCYDERKYFLLYRGVWPICDIQPDKQEQMPMEESANLLLMLAGIVQRLNTTDFLQPYWKVMEGWAQYLNSTLPDPGNQLCTDDFV